jgi:hypothetical protein
LHVDARDVVSDCLRVSLLDLAHVNCVPGHGPAHVPLFGHFLANVEDRLNRVDDLSRFFSALVLPVNLTAEVVLKLAVFTRNFLNLVLNFLHLLRLLIHLCGHLLNLLAFFCFDLFHPLVDLRLALFQDLVLLLQVDKPIAKPLNLNLLVRFARLAALASCDDLCELFILDYRLQKN